MTGFKITDIAFGSLLSILLTLFVIGILNNDLDEWIWISAASLLTAVMVLGLGFLFYWERRKISPR